MALYDRPKPDEAEISLFGPGVGECIVLHLGCDTWAVIDSCRSTDSSTSVAMEYLTGLGVDIAQKVRLVLATHWHDDHVSGMGDLINAATNAQFACSIALKNEEFRQLLVSQDLIKNVAATSGASEFRNILEILKSRNQIGPHIWAIEGSPLLRLSPFAIELQAISPSAATISSTKLRLRELLPQKSAQIRSISNPSPNDCSVAVLLRTCTSHALLGADLEVSGDKQRGWKAAIGLPTRHPISSATYKVAHHGSENGDCDEIWGICEPDAVALLTSYGKGRKPLPSPNDISRIKSRTSRAYLTSMPASSAPKRRKGVDSRMNSVAKRRRMLHDHGHIRLRFSLVSIAPPEIRLFGSAQQL